MWAFESAEDLKAFREVQGEGVISFYLDDAIDMEKLRAIYEAKQDFDKLVGEKWHLLIPHKDSGLTPEFADNPKAYDIELSYQIADGLTLDTSELPALIFTDPAHEKALLILKLGHLDRNETVRRVKDIANVITRPRELAYKNPEAFRSEVIAEIKMRYRNEAVVSFIQAAKPCLNWLRGLLAA